MKYFLTTLLALFVHVASAAEFEYKKVSPNLGRVSQVWFLYITGAFKPGDADKLERIIRKDIGLFVIAPIVVTSTGGDVSEALRIANLIKKAYSSVTVVERTGPCMSACFFLVAAAATRYMDGRIGIHRPYLTDERAANLSIAQMEQKQNAMYRAVRAYLAQAELPQYLSDKMLASGSTEMYWLSDIDKEAIGFRAAWYEQMLITRCGLDKKLEERFFNTNDEALLAPIREMQKCEASLKIDGAIKNLRQHFAKKDK